MVGLLLTILNRVGEVLSKLSGIDRKLDPITKALDKLSREQEEIEGKIADIEKQLAIIGDTTQKILDELTKPHIVEGRLTFGTAVPQ